MCTINITKDIETINIINKAKNNELDIIHHEDYCTTFDSQSNASL